MGPRRERDPDDEDETEEAPEEEEDTPEEEEPEAPVQVAPVAAKKKGKKGIGAPNPLGIVTKKNEWKSKEAPQLWGEVLAMLTKTGHAAYEVGIAITSVTQGFQKPLEHIEGSSVMGDANVSPGQQLENAIIDRVHIPLYQAGGTASLYECIFYWKTTSQQIARGRINLGSVEQIMAIRRRRIELEREANGMGAPQEQQRPMPGFAPRQQGYGPPGYAPMPLPGYQPLPQNDGGELAMLREQLRQSAEREQYMRGMLDELARAQREGRAPVITPPPQQAAVGMGAPPPPQQDMEAMLERLFMKMAPVLGLRGPMQQATPQSTLEAEMGSAFRDMMRMMMSETTKKISHVMKESITGMGAPMEPFEPELPIVPPDPKDGLPFNAIPLDSKWGDGRPVVYTTKKEGGGVDWMGAVFSNPLLVEKFGETLQKVGEAFVDTVKKVGVSGPHFVNNIPQGAQQAGAEPAKPNGSGGGNFGSGW